VTKEKAQPQVTIYYVNSYYVNAYCVNSYHVSDLQHGDINSNNCTNETLGTATRNIRNFGM
jgi:hypothetical protein